MWFIVLKLNNVEPYHKYQMQEQNSSLGAYATVAMKATKSRVPFLRNTGTQMGLGPLNFHNAKVCRRRLIKLITNSERLQNAF